ncbi:hypothetical protein V6N11_072133 [Hibiscus sabdariffa]|uniref:Uncharacterized protein n=1 Tax=Hibiscus sabdariffa TaxID=183260 RepID=A0ABR2U2G4_9ROSI
MKDKFACDECIETTTRNLLQPLEGNETAIVLNRNHHTVSIELQHRLVDLDLPRLRLDDGEPAPMFVPGPEGF